MSRPVAIFDIDGTLIRWQMYHALVDNLAQKGLIDEKDYHHMLQARMAWKNRRDSFSAYEHTTIGAFESALIKIEPDDLTIAAREVIEIYKNQTYTFTRDLLKTLKKQNFVLWAISGSHQELIRLLSKHFGFDDFVATEYVIKNGRFTGEKIAHVANKAVALDQLLKKHNANLENSIGVGDSPSDIPILERVATPIAFNPDKSLHDQARKAGWKIAVERKNVVYEI